MKQLICMHYFFNSRPVATASFGLLLFSSVSVFSNDSDHSLLGASYDLPGIYLERIADQSETLIPMLKMQYDLCVMQKNIARTEYLNKSAAWFGMKNSLSSQYVLYISEPPSPEPDWIKEGVGINREEEYFYGNKYAHFRYGKKFRISRNDGLCLLESYAEYEKQYIDDGEYHYKVKLKNKKNITSLSGRSVLKKDLYKSVKARRSVSPVLLREKNDAELNNLVKDHSILLMDMVNRSLPQSGSQINSYLTVKSNELKHSGVFDLFQLQQIPETQRKESSLKNRDETVLLDHSCKNSESGIAKGSVCYWRQMSYYPTIMERPIILKKEQKLGQKRAVEKAVRFELHRQFKDEIFAPPTGVKVNTVGTFKQ